jgi:tungstate transport system substrate-binding protein
MRRALGAMALLLAACAREHPAASFTLAATNTLQDSGVLPMLVSEFQRDSGIAVELVVLDPQEALSRQPQAGVTITDDRAAERRLLKTNPAKVYQQFLWNDFVIVGPPADPADVTHARSAADAFRRISQTHRLFMTRNDQSVTNRKERAIWKAALIFPEFNPAYLKMEQPMAGLLRSANGMRAYTLTDRATFDQLSGTLQLRVLFDGDPFLRNVYAVTLVKPSADAERFVAWLLHGRGHTLLERYQIKGKRAFQMM